AYLKYLVEKYTVDKLILDFETAYTEDVEKEFSAHECQKSMMMTFGGFNGPSRKQVIVYSIPFIGDKALLRMKPSNFPLTTVEVFVNDNNI
ncbi:hypothetical protein ABTN55_19835, partial [Acinetobacter baumannii]